MAALKQISWSHYIILPVILVLIVVKNVLPPTLRHFPSAGCTLTKAARRDNETSSNALPHTFDTEDWPELRQKLCPSMRPNPKAWQTIFQLARMELNFEQLSYEEDDQMKMIDNEETFFQFSSGGSGYANLRQNGSQSLVYLTVWKGGNNFIRANLDRSPGLKHGYSYYDDNTQAQLFRKMGIIQPIDGAPNKHSANSATTTCIVTAVRDPVSHFLSAYNEIEYRSAHNPDEDRLPKAGKAGTPLLLFTRYKFGTTQRFRQFVADFLTGPRRAGFGDPHQAQLNHLSSMTGILYEMNRINDCFGPRSNMSLPWTLPKELSLTAYLPTQQNMSLAFPNMMMDSCPGLPSDFGRRFDKGFDHHASSKDEFGFYKAAKQVWREGGDIARSLCALHVYDYACYDLSIPDICKEVFAQEKFREEILISLNADGTTKYEDKRKCRKFQNVH